jgi:Na+-transporting methylmalonyl-CoA/oxaloacetate decarboxylase gamma subunit
MLNNLLSLINQEGSLGLGEACLYALIGFCIVFIGIVIIIIVIRLIGLLMQKTDNLAFLSKKKTKKSEKPLDVKTAERTVSNADDGEISDEVKVAIVAALMAYYEKDKPHYEFKVKRIKRL